MASLDLVIWLNINVRSNLTPWNSVLRILCDRKLDIGMVRELCIRRDIGLKVGRDSKLGTGRLVIKHDIRNDMSLGENTNRVIIQF